LITASEGNLSARCGPGRLWITPSGVPKDAVAPEDLVAVDLEGRPIGGGRPSSELLMHLALYRERPDVEAAVHAHPPAATAFAAAGCVPDPAVMPESMVLLHPVRLVPYGAPSTEELAAQLAPLVAGCDTFLLAHHGALTAGRNVAEALFRMQALERLAEITLTAGPLGGPRRLGEAELESLEEIRRAYMKSPPPELKGAAPFGPPQRPASVQGGEKGRC